MATSTRINKSNPPSYLFCFKVYVQADGGVAVTMGNQRVVLSEEEIHALLVGVLEYARVFAVLHTSDDGIASTFSKSKKNTLANGN